MSVNTQQVTSFMSTLYYKHCRLSHWYWYVHYLLRQTVPPTVCLWQVAGQVRDLPSSLNAGKQLVLQTAKKQKWVTKTEPRFINVIVTVTVIVVTVVSSSTSVIITISTLLTMLAFRTSAFSQYGVCTSAAQSFGGNVMKKHVWRI
jgi:hypothetical protein